MMLLPRDSGTLMVFLAHLPGFKMGGGDSSGYEGPLTVLKPRWRPGEQVGGALRPEPSGSHRVSQWTITTDRAQ